MHSFTRAGIFLSLAWVLACDNTPAPPAFTQAQTLGGVEVSAEELNRGALLYGRYCASCHGPEGDGKGPAASSLSQPPRDFQKARFRYATNDPEQLPSHEQLKTIIQRGVPAKGMPPWTGLRDEDLSALAFYIKTFSSRWSEGSGPDAKAP